MYRCEDCGSLLENYEITTDLPESDECGCPYCHSWNCLEEVKKCANDDCDEYLSEEDDDFCKDCQKFMQEKVDDFIKEIRSIYNEKEIEYIMEYIQDLEV